MDLKDKLFEILWTDFKTSDFENWLYKQDSVDFENLVSKDTYLDIISEDYSMMRPDKIKLYLFDKLDVNLKDDWDKFVAGRYVPLIGICKNKQSLDYYSDNLRDWEVSVGQKHEIIEIYISTKDYDKHKQYIRYVERDRDLYPSGLIPMELFDINFDNVSDLYMIKYTGDLVELKPKDWCDDVYTPTQYSFWEDFYNDETKAVKTYYDTLDKLGIKNAWQSSRWPVAR